MGVESVVTQTQTSGYVCQCKGKSTAQCTICSMAAGIDLLSRHFLFQNVVSIIREGRNYTNLDLLVESFKD